MDILIFAPYTSTYRRQPYERSRGYKMEEIPRDGEMEFLYVWMNKINDEVLVGFKYSFELNQHLK